MGHDQSHHNETQGLEHDPVCGMDVDPKSPHTFTSQHNGKTWYFCSDACKKNFRANPGKYAPGKPPGQEGRGERGAS